MSLTMYLNLTDTAALQGGRPEAAGDNRGQSPLK